MVYDVSYIFRMKDGELIRSTETFSYKPTKDDIKDVGYIRLEELDAEKFIYHKIMKKKENK